MHISTKAHIPIYAGCMKRRTTKAAYRHKPIQKRARTTVDAMLDAVIKLLKRVGGTQVTTNQIAEAAGVSIGSLYQYFPDKRALFIALHQRHIEQVDQMIAQRISECVDSSLEQLVQSLMDGMVELHASDPELAELLQSEVPHRAGGTPAFSVRFHDVFRNAIAPHARTFGRKIDLDTRSFVVTNMLDALGHSIVLRRPRGLSLVQAKKGVLQSDIGLPRLLMKKTLNGPGYICSCFCGFLMCIEMLTMKA